MESKDDLISELRKRLHGRNGASLGIDGEQRVGKTTLAATLADKLTATKLSGDDFVRQGRLPYPQALALDELRETLAQHREANSPVVVESIMLQLILDAVGENADATVNVRRVAPDGSLVHAHFSDVAALRTTVAADKAFDEQFFPGRKTPSLVTEISGYHEGHRPHETADYLLSDGFADVS